MREGVMTMLFIGASIGVFMLVVAGNCKLRIWNSGGRLINAGGLSAAEKFKLISRWGARL
jgi:hypothetical protein